MTMSDDDFYKDPYAFTSGNCGQNLCSQCESAVCTHFCHDGDKFGFGAWRDRWNMDVEGAPPKPTISNLPIVYDPSVEKAPHHGKMPSWKDSKKVYLTWWGQLLTGLGIVVTLVLSIVTAIME